MLVGLYDSRLCNAEEDDGEEHLREEVQVVELYNEIILSTKGISTYSSSVREGRGSLDNDIVLKFGFLPRRTPIQSFAFNPLLSERDTLVRLEEGFTLDNEEIAGVLTGRRV